MDAHDSLLRAFLGGDLRAAEARRFDEHLLECEGCWQAVREDRAGKIAAQLLRQPVPGGLSDRVAFAVEVSAAARPRSRWACAPSGLRWPLAGGGAVLLAALVVLLVLVPGVRGAPPVPAAVQAVARYAQAIAATGPADGRPAAPVEVGRPVSLRVSGQRIVLRTWRLDGTEAVVAVSQQAFPMPAGASAGSGGGMAWSARLGTLSLYCINGRTSELVAAPVPAAELPNLAARLPLT
jgi:hypothetical protein